MYIGRRVDLQGGQGQAPAEGTQVYLDVSFATSASSEPGNTSVTTFTDLPQWMGSGSTSATSYSTALFNTTKITQGVDKGTFKLALDLDGFQGSLVGISIVQVLSEQKAQGQDLQYSALIPLLQRQVLCVDTTASTPSTLR